MMLLSCMAVIAMSTAQWENDFATAKRKAAENHRLILLNFSGSDWCIPCIRMHKDIFESEDFIKMSDSLLVLYNADFPRKKKNELGTDRRHRNDSLAAIYNPEGKFPFTLLMNSDGKILHRWDGYPAGGVKEMITTVKKESDEYRH